MTFGLFNGEDQIGFSCFANYVPCRKGERMKMHSNRVVIHPDYCGLGLGIVMVDEAAKIMCRRGFDVWAKFSSVPMYHARMKRPWWRLKNVHRHTKLLIGGNMKRAGGFRLDVKTFSFRFDVAKYEAARAHG